MNWTDDLLFAVATNTLAAPETGVFWKALAEDPELADRYSEIVALTEVLGSDVSPTEPSSERRARFIAALADTNRFEPYAETVAALLEITRDESLVWLSGLDNPENWGPGVLPGTTMWSVPTEREDVGIVWLKMPAGMEFPEHAHLGDEEVLVLQGRYIDHLGVLHPPGTILREPPETEHSFRIDADGPEFICLAIVHGGIRIGEHDVTRDALYGG